jgi:hypothetical protein
VLCKPTREPIQVFVVELGDRAQRVTERIA